MNLLRSPQCSLLRPSLWARLGNSSWLLPVVLLPLSHGVPLQSPPWLLWRHGSPPRWCCPRVPWLWPFLGGHRSPWGGGSFQLAGWPQWLPRLRGESPCHARPLLRGRPHQHRLATWMPGSRCPTAIEQSQQPRRTEAPSVHEHQLTHVPTTRAAQRAESVSAPTAPPSSATAMKTKRRKPSQLARESRLRKCFNCGERGHLSLECTRPCYKCNIAGHHSARCPYPVNRAPGQEASSSSPSSAQSTPERPVRPTSEGDPSTAVAQPPPQGVLPPTTPAPHPSLGWSLLTLSTFLPLPPAGRGAQLLDALNRNRSAAASGTRQPAPSIPSRQQGARTATTAGASAVPPSTSATLSGLSTASSREQQQLAAGASMESSSASAAVPGPSSTSTQEQPRSSSSTAPKVQPHLTPAQGQSVRGEATGQSASSSSGAQGASTSSSLTRATSAVAKVTASAKQQSTTSRRGKRSQRGKRSTRGQLPPPPPSHSVPPFPYDGDSHGMWQTLHWQKDLMIEKGTFSKDDFAFNCQQRIIMRDLTAGQRTADLTEEGFREYVSQLPPLASSKEELCTLLFPEEATMETDTAAPATSTEHESSTPSQRCVASPVEPQARPLGEMSPGRLSPVSPSEAALLSSSDEGSSSSTVVAASLPTQGPTDSSSTVGGITGFPHASGVSVGQSRCPIPGCAFVGGMEKIILYFLYFISLGAYRWGAKPGWVRLWREVPSFIFLWRGRGV